MVILSFSLVDLYFSIVGWRKWASNAQGLKLGSIINDSFAVCKPIVTSNMFISHVLLQWRVYTKQTQENIQLKPIWPYLVTQMSNCNSPSLTWMFNTTLLQMWVVERNKVHRIYVYFSLSCSYAPVDSKWNDVWSTWNGEGSSVYFWLSSWIMQKLSQWMQSLHSKNVAILLLISWPICYWEGYTYFKVSFHYIILGMTLEKIQLAPH